MEMNNRLAALEAQLRWLKRFLVVLVLGFGAILSVAAAQQNKFDTPVFGGVTVKDNNGKTTVKITDAGDMELAAKLTIGKTDVMAKLEDLQKRVDGFKSPPARAFVTFESIGPTNPLVPGIFGGVAKTDGFVIVQTGGKGTVSELYIDVGGNKPLTRQHPAAYSSLIAPVPKGETWQVRAQKLTNGKLDFNIDAGTCAVIWLPIQ